MLARLRRFKICRDCYLDATKGSGLCPGCREPYKVAEDEDDMPDFSSSALPLPAPGDATNNSEKTGLSLMRRNQPGEFDHNRFLFETSGTYGVGNAYWPKKEEPHGEGDGGFGDEMGAETTEKPWKPLSRKIPIPPSILSPYRYPIHHALTYPSSSLQKKKNTYTYTHI